MGANQAMSQMLGLVTHPMNTLGGLLGQQNQDPFWQTNAQLAGQNGPAYSTGPNDIVAAGQAAPAAAPTPAPVAHAPAAPSSYGMPQPQLLPDANPDTIAQQKQANQQRAGVPQAIYHSNAEFGTHGILRDVIGNVEDLGRRLLGFAPRYNDEKWSERAYGMTATNPDGTPDEATRAAATEAAMQYNPEKTEKYMQVLSGVQAQTANSQAMSEYRQAQVSSKASNLLGALAQRAQVQAQAIDPNDPNRQQKLDAIWQGMQNPVSKLQTQIYGKGNEPEVPDSYDPGYLSGLTQAGFTGTNMEHYQQGILTNENRIQLQQMRGDVAMKVANLHGQYQIQAAGILANSRMSVAEKEMALRQTIFDQEREDGAGPYRPFSERDITGATHPVPLTQIQQSPT